MKSKSFLSILGIVVVFLLSCNSQDTQSDNSGSINEAMNDDQTTEMGQDVTLNNDIDTVAYALGVVWGRSILGFKHQGLTDINLNIMQKALQDSYNEKTLNMSFDEADAFLQNYFQNLQKSTGDKNLQEGQAFLDENKKNDGVITLPSGLQYQVIEEGNGPSPTIDDKVTVHYHGTLIDGSVFDSSMDRGEPLSIEVKGVIPGWQEALTLMKVGAKWKIWVPSDLAYGNQQQGPGGPNAALIFDVELISID